MRPGMQIAADQDWWSVQTLAEGGKFAWKGLTGVHI
jgi:hypothetical protein